MVGDPESIRSFTKESAHGENHLIMTLINISVLCQNRSLSLQSALKSQRIAGTDGEAFVSMNCTSFLQVVRHTLHGKRECEEGM